MIRVITTLLLIVICSVPVAYAQDNASAESPYRGVEFRRWSAVVSDLDETIHLYTEILGLELGDVSIDSTNSYSYEVFAIDKSLQVRHATFHAGELKRALSVVEVAGIELPRPPQAPRLSIALFNAKGRFDEIVDQLIEQGYQTMTPHQLGESGKEIGFLDKDGHLYALYEYPYQGSKY